MALLAVGGAVAPASAGEELFLGRNLRLSRNAETVTLPLYRGTSHGDTVWYVVTESSNEEDAERRRVNHSEKMRNALGTRAVQRARSVGGTLDFTDTVDFSPERVVVPGPQGFPPAVAKAGAVGIGAYSPLVTPDGRLVLNATHVQNRTGTHDAVVSIDVARREVTMDLFRGFYNDKPLVYLHQEASVELVAAIEGSTLAPNLNFAPRAGSSEDDSARAAIIPIVNGERGVGNPQRQGLQSALLGEGDPLNITQVIPEQNEYTPVWDVTPAVWTDRAIATGQRELLTDDDDVADLFEEGLLVSGGTGPANASLEGLRALPGISNCPVVALLD